MISQSNLQNKAALLERLLDSPLAAEMERSLTNGVEAARRRIADELAVLTARHEARYAQMVTKSRAAQAKRDTLAKEAEAARIAAMDAIDRASIERDWFVHRRAELQRLISAGASYLAAQGLDSAEAAERHLGILK